MENGSSCTASSRLSDGDVFQIYRDMDSTKKRIIEQGQLLNMSAIMEAELERRGCDKTQFKKMARDLEDNDAEFYDFKRQYEDVKGYHSLSSSVSLIPEADIMKVYACATARKQQAIARDGWQLKDFKKTISSILDEEIQVAKLDKATFNKTAAKSSKEVLALKERYESVVSPLDQLEALKLLLVEGNAISLPFLLTNSVHSSRRPNSAAGTAFA
jgi:hypothetical protein